MIALSSSILFRESFIIRFFLHLMRYGFVLVRFNVINKAVTLI